MRSTTRIMAAARVFGTLAAAALALAACTSPGAAMRPGMVDRARMNRAVFAALKPGGLYVIADHSGRPGTGISESGTLHRVEEAFLRQEVESASFKLAASGNFLRNPNDPRDRNTPEPPQPKDEFVLKFVKP